MTGSVEVGNDVRDVVLEGTILREFKDFAVLGANDEEIDRIRWRIYTLTCSAADANDNAWPRTCPRRAASPI